MSRRKAMQLSATARAGFGCALAYEKPDTRHRVRLPTTDHSVPLWRAKSEGDYGGPVHRDVIRLTQTMAGVIRDRYVGPA